MVDVDLVLNKGFVQHLVNNPSRSGNQGDQGEAKQVWKVRGLRETQAGQQTKGTERSSARSEKSRGPRGSQAGQETKGSREAQFRHCGAQSAWVLLANGKGGLLCSHTWG